MILPTREEIAKIIWDAGIDHACAKFNVDRAEVTAFDPDSEACGRELAEADAVLALLASLQPAEGAREAYEECAKIAEGTRNEAVCASDLWAADKIAALIRARLSSPDAEGKQT